MPNWIVSAVIMFILREVASFGKATDWASIKKVIDARVNTMLPPFAQDGVDSVVNAVVDCFAGALTDVADLEKLSNDVLASNWPQAIADLEVLIANSAHPAAVRIKAALSQLATA